MLTMLTMLDTADDLQWAREVYAVPDWAQCCIVHGNMDAPDKIECYRVPMPAFDQAPDCVVYP